VNFGAAYYRPGMWRIRLKPHVSLRFKQMFPSIKKGDVSPFHLVDRPDTAVDLEWFFSRYPVTLSDAAADRLRTGVAESRRREEARDAILAGDWRPGAAVGFKEGRAPFPYQARAAALARETGRLLLLDDVGLGKTISSLAVIADGEHLPAAIVVQPHLSSQWIANYINDFTHLRAHEIKTTKPYRLPHADVYVFRYSNIAGWADYAADADFKAVIFDEIQELRHGDKTSKGRAAQAFVASRPLVMGLTATPIYNYGSEIFNVVELIAPGAFGSWDEFLTEWCRPHGNHWVVKDPGALGSYLQESAIALRRTEDSEEVKSQLPPLNRVIFEVDWNTDDAQDDQALRRALAQRVLHGSFTDRGQAARELDLMMRQMTGVAKARSVAAYVRMLVEAGEPVLLAGWHREVYSIWLKALADLNPVMFTGTESQNKKREAKAAFMDGRSKVMIMSLRSGAGLDGLQHRAAHVVYGELDWSPQVHVQVTGRLRRRGQKRQVTAHFLHVDNGSDPVLMETLGLKASQSHGILNPYSSGPTEQQQDQTRMQRLARQVLGLGEEE
jgi:hypothetical protein